MSRSVGDRLTARVLDAGSHTLRVGGRVAVVGGGPAGSLSALFLLQLARRLDQEIKVEIFEPRRFDRGGPGGCNHCGGIVSESLVQALAAEGINLPSSVVQRGIDSYGLHMDLGTVTIGSPVDEQRIAAVYRGNGPRGGEDMPWESFDGYLLALAEGAGAVVRPEMVRDIEWIEEKPVIRVTDATTRPYDLVVIATGVNSNLLAAPMMNRGPTRRTTKTARTYICEFRSDPATIRRELGNSMHVFMVDVPGVEFAALIPKGEFVTLAMLGENIDADVANRFLTAPAVRDFLRFESIPCVCSCSPLINIKGARHPYGDRIVMVGDAGVARLYKDGIGSAYRTAKAAATAALIHGVSADSFRRHYAPLCRSIVRDNRYGRIMFGFTWLFRKIPFLRRAVLRMTEREQSSETGTGPMSAALWNLFTGSAPYREVFWSTMKPGFLARLLGHTIASLRPRRKQRAHAT